MRGAVVPYGTPSEKGAVSFHCQTLSCERVSSFSLSSFLCERQYFFFGLF